MTLPISSPIKHVHDTQAHKYAMDVLEEKVVTGALIKQAAQRFVNDLGRDDLYFDLEQARKIVNYAALCRHWKGDKTGKPILLDPHQPFYLQQIFAWKRAETGQRRFRRSFKEIARKQYKTTELAVQGLYHVQVDNQEGALFVVGATKEDQARICLTDAGNIIDGSPALSKHFKVYRNKDKVTTIICPTNRGVMGTVGRDSKRSDGLDVSFSGIDEYHEHQDTSIRDILSSAQGKRLEPLESIITTAGFNINGPCYQKSRDTGIKILNGLIEDDEQLVIIYEMDDYDQWENEELWICANPNIPYSSSTLKNLRSDYIRAKNEGGQTEVGFKTKLLNMWVNSPDTWIQHETIQSNNHGITEEELMEKECYVGVDCSAGKDLNAMALFFPNVRESIHAVKMLFWIPEEKMMFAKYEADYVKWKQTGHMNVLEGNAVEYTKMADQAIRICQRYSVKSFGFDARYFYMGLAEQYHGAGYGDKMYPVGQGFNLSGAARQLENWTANNEMDFMNNPVLEWNFSNVVLTIGDKGDIFPNKNKSQNKIDGVTALLDAIYEYLRLKAEPIKQSGIEIWN
jgi:phage terminase large subunit-like protein